MQRTELISDHPNTIPLVNESSGSAVSWSAIIAGAVSTAAGPVMTNDNDMFSLDYFTDALMRPEDPTSSPYSQSDNSKEIFTILSRNLMQGELSAEDETYVVNVIAQRAGISESDARTRLQQVSEHAKKAIDDVEAQTRKTADEARKAAATFALWAFASLLLGAFVASFAATWGGRTRDS